METSHLNPSPHSECLPHLGHISASEVTLTIGQDRWLHLILSHESLTDHEFFLWETLWPVERSKTAVTLEYFHSSSCTYHREYHWPVRPSWNAHVVGQISIISFAFAVTGGKVHAWRCPAYSLISFKLLNIIFRPCFSGPNLIVILGLSA